MVTLDENNQPAALLTATGQSAESRSIGFEGQFEIASWTITERQRHCTRHGPRLH
ncbi:hypothetical protein [Sphingomonas sp.]|uniref:hypothetical protein n=1 Tax=Sphingomonas sp. TaxID=28214 RepID=UPI001835B629|nr:hypothetical protein [Sphingomonas sp.]MBA4761190.1 hypothetical protein [Sphingomonas sp.]